MKRSLIPIRNKQNKLTRRFREGERTTTDLQALREVQDQFDSLIERMLEAKLMLAGLAIGGDEAYAGYNTIASNQECEID
jgi:hypothetical protein